MAHRRQPRAMKWSSRRPAVGDPTGDLVAYADLLARARVWVYEADDVERPGRLALLVEAEQEYAGRVTNPQSGRLSELDEGFTAMGYRERDL